MISDYLTEEFVRRRTMLASRAELLNAIREMPLADLDAFLAANSEFTGVEALLNEARRESMGATPEEWYGPQ